MKRPVWCHRLAFWANHWALYFTWRRRYDRACAERYAEMCGWNLPPEERVRRFREAAGDAPVAHWPPRSES